MGIQRRSKWTSSDRSQTRMHSLPLRTSSQSHLRRLHRYHPSHHLPSIVPIVRPPLHRSRIMRRRITLNPHRNLCNIWGRYNSRAKSSKWSKMSPVEVVASASSCEMSVWRSDAFHPLAFPACSSHFAPPQTSLCRRQGIAFASFMSHAYRFSFAFVPCHY